MDSSSSDAYDFPERVARYDRDMDIMHPLRSKMIEIGVEVLPFDAAEKLRVLDLGVGTGVFSKQLMTAYPKASIVAVDGAASMLDLTATRLTNLSERIQWVHADFRALPNQITGPEKYDVVISSYALHHLNPEEKQAVLNSVVYSMRIGGWLLNADLVAASSPEIERRIQMIRVAGVTARAPESDERFGNEQATRQLLDELEALENDQPLSLDEDLRILRESGVTNAEVFWREYREVVLGGSRT